jgi:hypothetical protein
MICCAARRRLRDKSPLGIAGRRIIRGFRLLRSAVTLRDAQKIAEETVRQKAVTHGPHEEESYGALR